MNMYTVHVTAPENVKKERKRYGMETQNRNIKTQFYTQCPNFFLAYTNSYYRSSYYTKAGSQKPRKHHLQRLPPRGMGIWRRLELPIIVSFQWHLLLDF